MPIKKLFLEKKLIYKIAKVIFLILPLLVAVVAILKGYININALFQKNISDVMQKNIVYICCVVIGLVLYYKVTKSFFKILPLLVAALIFLKGNININNAFPKNGHINISAIFQKNILNILQKNNIYIIYAVIGLALYYFLINRIDNKIYRIKNSLNSAENSPYAGEAGIVGLLADRAAGSSFQDFFPMSFPTEEINVRVYRDEEESLAGYKTFDFDYTNKTNPLLEKELFRYLEKVLQTHDLARDEKNPQVIISMDFFIGKKEQYTPPTTVTSTELKQEWNFGMIGWSVGGFSSEVPVTSSTTTPGYTTTTYYSNIRLNFLNHAKLVKGSKLKTPPLIWLGEADSEGLNPDIRGIAPIMFSELLGEFPDKSSEAPKRYVQHFCYGGLGLGFDQKDWRVIRYVEPFSVAAEYGIKPGDILMEINGKRTNSWPAVSHRETTMAYRSKDPYFQYVLSNHGDSGVDVTIESAETGKRVTLQIKPRSENRYVRVSISHPLQEIIRANPLGILFVIIVTAIIIYYFFLK